MTRITTLLAAVWLAACSDATMGPDGPGVSEGGPEDPGGRQPVTSMSGSQSGSEDILECVVAERIAVVDATAVPQGAVISPAGYVETLASEWTGQLTAEGAGALSVTLDADTSTLEFVVYADESWEDGDPVPYGVDDGCEDRYEIDVVMHVTSGDALDELVAVSAWGWSDYTFLSVPARIDGADVTGSLQPVSFDLSTAADPWLLLAFNKTTSSTRLGVHWYDDKAVDDTDHPVIDSFDPVALTPR